MISKPFILVGLGNKGSKYDDTRHNIGFLVIDELARRWRVRIEREKWNSLSNCVQLFGNKIFFLKPMTFMNLSGRGVADFAQFYKIDIDHILAIHDDLDMAPGRIKLVKGGGTGGHKGIKSLVEHLGGRDFFRLKVGIGRPGQGSVHNDFPIEKYVLGTIGEHDLSLLESRCNAIEEGVRRFFEDGPARAMSILNSLK
jgi:PTH1 family peptidyl-tRNA hydrolase